MFHTTKFHNKHRFRCLTLSICIILAGCAKSSSEVTSAYVSPLQYQAYSCDQISAELIRINGRISELGGTLDQSSSTDAAITAVGAVFFWPILFALGGTKQQEAEYSKLKGELDALNQSAIQKRCFSSLYVRNGNTQTSPIPASANSTSESKSKLSLDESAEKCKKLGMPTGTEQFGKCVLTLSR